MKLFLCPHCHDVKKIVQNEHRTCLCGKSSGQLDDPLYAKIYGDAIPIGFANPSLASAIHNQPEIGMGKVFTAFIIPKNCDTITKV